MGITLGGFSGLDTSNMIQQLMWIEEAPIRRLEDKQGEMNQQISAWRKINSSLDNLRSKAWDLESIFDEMSASSSDEEVVTATVAPGTSSGSYDITVSNLAKAHRVASASQIGAPDSLTLSGDFKINGTNIDVSGVTTLDGVAKAINDQALDTDDNQIATATVIDSKLVIESAQTGASNELSFTDTNGTLENDLNFAFNTGSIEDTASELQDGIDAKFDVNGITDITSSSNIVEDVIEGITLNLENVGTSTIEVNTDQEAIKEKLQAFVDAYNSIQDNLAKLGGKEAVLQGDATLTSIETRMYDSVIRPVDEASLSKDTLSMVGIEVDNKGKLSIDSSKLDENLTDNLADIKKMFTATKTDDGVSGIIERVESEVDSAITSFESDSSTSYDGYIKGKIKTLEDEVDYIDDDIANMKRRLELREERLRAEFTQMETLISEMNNQGSWMSAQFSSMMSGA